MSFLSPLIGHFTCAPSDPTHPTIIVPCGATQPTTYPRWSHAEKFQCFSVKNKFSKHPRTMVGIFVWKGQRQCTVFLWPLIGPFTYTRSGLAHPTFIVCPFPWTHAERVWRISGNICSKHVSKLTSVGLSVGSSVDFQGPKNSKYNSKRFQFGRSMTLTWAQHGHATF